METIFVTGATGAIGASLVKQLVERGKKVKALVRDLNRAKLILPSNCELVLGDVTSKESILKGMEGTDTVFHAAGLPEQWFKNPKIFQEVNVNGTKNILDSAVTMGIKKFIYTSTIDVFEGFAGKEYNEKKIDPNPKHTYYERSKQEADKLAVKALQKGLDVVFLHPSGVYGPGPGKSPGANQFIKDLILGKIPLLLPGGFPVVYVDDCALGHILAFEKGKKGDRYILSDRYISLLDLAKLVNEIHSLNKIPKVMPFWIAKSISIVGESFSPISGNPPLLPKGQLEFLRWQAIPNASRAKKELGWQPIDLKEGIKKTINFLFQNKESNHS
ncbi:MAG: NAD-dependent epimerase/dehydratase family protein [Leptospiraceae bacterium]|nr:NAD-dependent epimerase/dehydratase family protein [Leptospiraceae bacterium]